MKNTTVKFLFLMFFPALSSCNFNPGSNSTIPESAKKCTFSTRLKTRIETNKKVKCTEIDDLALLEFSKGRSLSNINSFYRQNKCLKKSQLVSFFSALEGEINGNNQKATNSWLSFLEKNNSLNSILDWLASFQLDRINISNLETAQKIIDLSTNNNYLPIIPIALKAFKFSHKKPSKKWLLSHGISPFTTWHQLQPVSGRAHFFEEISSITSLNPDKTQKAKFGKENFEPLNHYLITRRFCNRTKNITVAFQTQGPVQISIDNQIIIATSGRKYTENGATVETLKIDPGCHQVAFRFVPTRNSNQIFLSLTETKPKKHDPGLFKHLSSPNCTATANHFYRKLTQVSRELSSHNFYRTRLEIDALQNISTRNNFVKKLSYLALQDDPTLPSISYEQKLLNLEAGSDLFPWLKCQIAQTSRQNNKLNKAAKNLKQCFSECCLLEKVELLKKNQDYQKAWEQMLLLLEKVDNNAAYYKLAAELSHKIGNSGQQFKWLREAASINPSRYPALADFFLSLDQTDKARKNLLHNYPHLKTTVAGRKLLYKILLKEDKLAEALKIQKKIYRQKSDYQNEVLKLADHYFLLDQKEKAFNLLKSHLIKNPDHARVYRLLELHNRLPFTFGPETQELINKFYKSEPGSPHYARFIFKCRKIHLFEEGTGFILVKKAIKINSEHAIKVLGEISIPENAYLLRLETLKKNNDTYYPLATLYQNTFTLKRLEKGNVILLEYILPLAENTNSKHFADKIFSFNHSHLPTTYSCYEIEMPSHFKFNFEKGAGVPGPEIQKKGKSVSYTFKMWDLKPKVRERFMLRYLKKENYLKTFTNLSPRKYAQQIKQQLPWTDNGSYELKKITEKLCKKQKNKRCINNIFRWVQTNIEQDFSQTDPLKIFHERKGSRAFLLHEMFKYLPLKSTLVFAVNNRLVSGKFTYLPFEHFKYALVKVGQDTYIDPRYNYNPPGKIVPALSNSLAWSPGKKLFRLPRNPAKIRKLDIKLNTSRFRKAVFQIQEKIKGFGVLKLKKYYFDKGFKVFEKLVHQSLQNYFPSASLTWVRVNSTRNNYSYFNYRYKFSAYGAFNRLNLEEIELRKIPFNWDLPSKFNIHKKRHTVFLPPALSETDISIKIIPPRGWAVSSDPILEAESKFGFLRRKLRTDKTGKGFLTIKKKINRKPVKPENWKEFVKFIKEFDKYENFPAVFQKL
ncbi:MAG: tetratricopeptide repeat protein [Myxococcota bacterium]